MASNTPSRHQDASGAMAAASTQPDHISLRVITLTHGSDREADLYLVLNLTTKVGELKESLQQHLGQHPRPDHQRLIYQGRPLLDNNATLQSILRLDPSTNPPPVHVLHLVIREQQASSTNPASTARPQTAQTGISSNDTPPVPQPNQNQLPPNLSQPVLPGMAAAQQLIQNQMNAIQQHMAMHHQHLANAHPGLPQAHLRGMLPFQGVPGMGLGLGQPGAQARTLPGTPDSDTRPGTPRGAPVTHGLPQHMQAGMTTRVQETIGPNGERIRTVINTSGPFPPTHLTAPQFNPVERSASAPGLPHRPISPLPTVTATSPDTAGALPPVQPPPPLPMIPGHFARTMMHPFGVQPAVQPQLPPANPTVYLLSSSAGPQAVVFAPGHGYFTTPTSTHPTGDGTSQPSSTTIQPPQATPTQPPTQDVPINNDANPVRAEIVLRPAQRQNQPPAAARPQRREAEDLLAFFLQRGWLFLRLYMFIYVLSEAGTWRRTVLLGMAVFVCLLPRQNPLTDAFNVVRRHFDNLIGPPQAPQRQMPAQQPGQNQNADAGHDQPTTPANEATRRSQNMPTPEEHARRLLREHQMQNPSFIRGVLRSVEQAVALFLASLVPGVGERHVRAREEARRIVQEEDRRRREAEASNTPSSAEQQMPSQPESAAETSTDVNQGSGDPKRRDAPISDSSRTEAEHAVVGTSTGIDASSTTSSVPTAEPADAEGVRRRVDAGSASSSGQTS